MLLLVGAAVAIRWVWLDITYWSRSALLSYGSGDLEACVRLVSLQWPGARVRPDEGGIALDLPALDGVRLRPEGDQTARLIVHGHSASISTLGPSSEEETQALLKRLLGDFDLWCGGGNELRPDQRR